MMRLDKFLCSCHTGTRTEVKKHIKAGAVTINGTTATKPEQKVDENSDIVLFRGKRLAYEQFAYYLLYKEAGYVTAVSDSLHQTVMDELPAELRGKVTPVGRLDKDTEGALLFTNDGAFAHHILSPAHHVSKTYEAVLDRPVPESAIRQFATGVDIGDDTPTLPAVLTLNAEATTATLTISEGRYHQVKRMFSAVGCEVTYLKRLSIGTLTLEKMLPGECKKLTPAEVERLYKKH